MSIGIMSKWILKYKVLCQIIFLVFYFGMFLQIQIYDLKYNFEDRQPHLYINVETVLYLSDKIFPNNVMIDIIFIINIY